MVVTHSDASPSDEPPAADNAFSGPEEPEEDEGEDQEVQPPPSEPQELPDEPLDAADDPMLPADAPADDLSAPEPGNEAHVETDPTGPNGNVAVAPPPTQPQNGQGHPHSRRPHDRGDHRGGRRDHHGHQDHRGRPTDRRHHMVHEVLRKGQEILVQVAKEGLGQKGPALTMYLSIPGRYLVLMPAISRLGVSKRIDDEGQRRELKDILNGLKIPDGMGVIVRTAGMGRKREELQRDLDFLLNVWETMKKKEIGRAHV
jgi:Rne/Rng family ribonuclease